MEYLDLQWYVEYGGLLTPFDLCKRQAKQIENPDDFEVRFPDNRRNTFL